MCVLLFAVCCFVRSEHVERNWGPSESLVPDVTEILWSFDKVVSAQNGNLFSPPGKPSMRLSQFDVFLQRRWLELEKHSSYVGIGADDYCNIRYTVFVLHLEVNICAYYVLCELVFIGAQDTCITLKITITCDLFFFLYFALILTVWGKYSSCCLNSVNLEELKSDYRLWKASWSCCCVVRHVFWSAYSPSHWIMCL